MKYEKWSLGYAILKQYIRITQWVIHKEVKVIGLENIPKNKPLVIAPNHQNGLSDPMSVLLHTYFQPVWLARADIFKKPLVILILRFLKIMPVYRMRDGKEQLSKNEETFAASIKVLENNFPLALFPEAAHSSKRQMLSHKKAVPRIVFMAEERTEKNLDIQIIPTGIYYSSYWKFNRSIIVNFGKPVCVNDYLKTYATNPKQATAKLREDLRAAIHQQIIDIQSKNYYDDFENIRKIYSRTNTENSGKKATLLNRFTCDQKLVEKLCYLEENNPEETESLVKQTRVFSSLLKNYKLRSWLLTHPGKNIPMILLNIITLLVFSPVFIFGFIFNALPFFALDIPIRKKMKDQGFWSTFSFAGSLLLFPIAYLIELGIIVWWLPKLWMGIVLLICFPLSLKFGFRWYILLRKTVGRVRLFLLKVFKKSEFTEIVESRDSLFKMLKENSIY